MQPIVHLVVGYVCVAAYWRWTRGRPPGDVVTAAALFGAALPDLLDKPPWLLGIAPVGRTLGHSLLFVVPLAVGIRLLTAGLDRRPIGTAAVVGLLSHVATDVPWHVLSGDYVELRFLLWPLAQTPPYTGTKPLATAGGLEITTLWLEAVVFVGGVALWWADGRPGVAAVRRRLLE